VPRSAFLEGAREAGRTKTGTGAKAKQKTAVPQGAASLRSRCLRAMGEKGKGVATNSADWWAVGRRGKTRDGDNVRAIPRLTAAKATGA
jgi:hypothetical protein